MKKWVRLPAFFLVCCMLVNLVPTSLLKVDAAVRKEQTDENADKSSMGVSESQPNDRVTPSSMIAVTPIYEENETKKMDALQERKESQVLTDGQARTADGVYQSSLKIWFDADSGTVTDAAEDIETLDLPQSIGGAEVKAIGKQAFSGCTALSHITLPKSLSSIGDYAFYGCKALTAIVIPKGVTEIPWYAFYGCTSLTEAVLPEGLEKIWDGAFENCRSLTAIAVPEGTNQIGLTHDNYDQSTGDGGYFYSGVFSGCVKLKEVSFENGLTVLGNDVFSGCAALEAVQLPEGVQIIGGDAFKNCTSLTSISLPESLQAISLRMFLGCKSLKEIEIPHGVTEIQMYAFSGCTELSSVVIPESVTRLGFGFDYRGWDFTVHYCGSVFQNCPNLTYITIPENVTAITDEDDPPRPIGNEYSVQHEVNFDNTTILRVKEGSRAEQYAISHGLNYIYYFDEKAMTLDLRAPDGTPVTDGYGVVWYGRGSDVPLSNGAKLFAVDSQKKYDVEIKLSDRLLESYLQPGRQPAEFQKTGNGYLTRYVLEERGQTSVSGTVTDESGAPIAGAVVVFEQTFEKHKKSSSVITDGSGGFMANLFCVPTQTSCHADGYARKEGIGVSPDGVSFAVGAIAMKRLSSERIRIDMEKVAAAKEGKQGKVERIATFGGIEFSLYNQTKKQEITLFEAQYPYLYLEEGQADAGDQIRITANDASGSFVAAEESAIFSDIMEASVDLTLISRGSFTVAVDQRASGYLFDPEGRFVSSYTGSSALSSDPLAAGTYSLVLFKNAPFSSLSGLSVLDDLGLKMGTDYLLMNVSVADGKITDLGMQHIPDFQALAFQSMIPGSTGCTAKKSEVSVGSLLAVRMEYAVQKNCPSSQETAVIDLPEGLSVIPGSLTVDGTQKNYLAQGDRVMVNIGQRAAVLRFYVSASDAGHYALNTYLSYQTEAGAMLHPVGTAEFTATELALSAVSETGLKTAIVSGSALPKSEVWVYDNNIKIATAIANAAGTWSVRFDLVEPDSHSRHEIYAEMVSAYGVKYRTASHRLIYDESYRDLKRITMTHRMSTVVVDYQEANSGTLSYGYDQGLPFSFKVEFMGGRDNERVRSDLMQNVQVAVSTADGDVTEVDCIYDMENDCYIGAYSGECAVVGFWASYEQPSVKSIYTFVGEGGGNEGEHFAYTPQIKGSAYRAPSESMLFGLNDSYPKKASNGTVTLFLDGRLFEPDVEVSLCDEEIEYPAQNIYWVNHQRIYATFDLADVSDGTYSVMASCNGASDTLSNCLVVDSSLAPGTGRLEMNFSESAKVGAEYEGSITVKNTGYTDLYAPVLMLSGENIQFKLDRENEYVGEGEVFIQNKEGLSGVIAPGETASVNLIYRVVAAGEFTLKADDYSKKRGNLYEKKMLNADSGVSDILTANVLSLVGTGYLEYTKNMADMASAVGLGYSGVITVELLESAYEQNARGDLGGGDEFSVVDISAGGLTARRTFSNSLHRKQLCGTYGYGWNSDYELKAEYIRKDETECIVLSDAESIMMFAKDDKNGKFVEIFAGEDTAARRNDGSIEIQRKNGLCYTFGKDGHQESVTDAYGNTVTYTYEDGRLVSAASSNGDALVYTYRNGKIVSVTSAVTKDRAEYRYDGDYLESVTTKFGTTTYHYDKSSVGGRRGTLTGIDYADGTSVTYIYDDLGRFVGATDALGHTVRYEEDANGRLSAAIYPDGSKVSYTYDAKGNIATAKSCDGVTGTYRYDERNNLVRVDFSTGNWIVYTYNEKDYLTGINEDGNITAIVYDEKGLPTQIIYPDEKTVSYGYDELGRRTSVTDSEGNVTRYAYNALGWLERVYDGETEAIFYIYNKDGTLAKQQNANGTSTAYAYHSGRLSEICNYGMGESILSRFALTYDKYGYICSMETNEGAWKYEYDRAGQMTKASAPDGSVTEYVYDAAGNRIRVKEGQKTIDYTVNSMNQYQMAGGVARSYDANGNLTTETSASGTAAYEWDYRGRLAKMTTADGHVYEYGYDAFGGRNRVSVDGVATEYVNDPTGIGFALTAYADGDISRYLISGGIAAVDVGSGLCFYSFNQLGSTVGITSPDGMLANRYVYDA